MTRRVPGFISARFRRATGLCTPSQTVALSRCKSANEYAEGSVLSRYSAGMAFHLFQRNERLFYTRVYHGSTWQELERRKAAATSVRRKLKRNWAQEHYTRRTFRRFPRATRTIQRFRKGVLPN